MIRKINQETWKWFIDKTQLGTFLGATPLEYDLINEAINEFNFSDALVLVKVGLKDDLELHFIFSNEGIINIVTPSGKVLIPPENQGDYELYKAMPKSAGVNMQFYGMMEAEFGGEFSVPMMTITDMKIREAKSKKQELADKIATFNFYNSNNSLNIPHDPLTDIVMIAGKSNISEWSEEYEYTKKYIQIQKIVLDTLMQSYIGEQIQKEIDEISAELEKEQSNRPRLVPDEHDPKILHFIRPNDPNDESEK